MQTLKGKYLTKDTIKEKKNFSKNKLLQEVTRNVFLIKIYSILSNIRYK